MQRPPPSTWSWFGAFAGDVAIPEYSAWALDVAARELPTTIQIAYDLGFFGVRPPPILVRVQTIPAVIPSYWSLYLRGILTTPSQTSSYTYSESE